MASSIGRGAASVTGNPLIAAASRAGSCIASAGNSSCNSASLMPSSPRRLFRWLDQRTRAARMRHLREDLPGRSVGQQVQLEAGAAPRTDLVAQQGRSGVDQAAFHAGDGGHEFTLAMERPEADRHRLERLAGEARGEVVAPAAAHVEPAVGDGNSSATETPRCTSSGTHAPSEPSRPSSRRPAPAPPPLHARVRSPRGVCEPQCAVGASSRSSDGASGNARRRRAGDAARRAAAALLSVGSERRGRSCRRRWRRRGRAPTRAAPAHRRRRSQRLQLRSPLAVARRRMHRRLRVREVQAALAGQQELAAG